MIIQRLAKALSSIQQALRSWAILVRFLSSLDRHDMDFYRGLDERATRG